MEKTTSANCHADITVSVIVPVYNREKTIGRALASIQAQTYADFEVIIVDDGCTDASAEIIRPFLSDPRFSYFRQANSGKPSLARNAGVKKAKGAWLAFLDSDDTWEPGKLDAQIATLQAFAQDEVKLVFSDNSKYLDDKQLFASFIKKLGLTQALDQSERLRCAHGRLFDMPGFRATLCGCGFLMTQGILVEKAAFVQAGMFDAALVFAEDTDIWLSIASRYQVAQAFGVGFNYFCHAGSITAEKNALLFQDTIAVLEKHRAHLKEDLACRKALNTRIKRYKLEELTFNLKHGKWLKNQALEIRPFFSVYWQKDLIRALLNCVLSMRFVIHWGQRR